MSPILNCILCAFNQCLNYSELSAPEFPEVPLIALQLQYKSSDYLSQPVLSLKQNLSG